jgi:hypothetical protein
MGRNRCQQSVDGIEGGIEENNVRAHGRAPLSEQPEQ